VDASLNPLVFEGPVQCVAQPHSGDWRLRGRLRSADAGKPSASVELLLSGMRSVASVPRLPPRLNELRVQLVANLPQERGAYRLQLGAREGSFVLEVQALRVHHDVSRSFYHALPRIPLPPLTRAGWAVLLTLLRVPLVSRLLNRERPV
jgi:hypothetical protein